ncbi:MAG: ABC transporter permease [Muribaculaceae bacterium]|nr:ABC transporter permease [Muribaculaceae bacterium]
MTFPLRVALRYLISKKQHNAVNIISWISLAGVAVATMALVVVLSVFNGFNSLALSQLSQMEPPLALFPSKGKVIADADSLARRLAALDGVTAAMPVLHEQGLVRAGSKQMPVTLTGVTDDYLRAVAIDSIIIDGEALLRSEEPLTALSSVGVALGTDVRPMSELPLELYVPRRVGRINTANPATAFRSDVFYMAGVFRVGQDNYDADMLIIPLPAARQLLDYTTEASEIAIFTPDPEKLRPVVAETAGEGFIVKNRIQQQEHSFRMIQSEKWITFLMLTFILIIASFNIISTLAMLIIEKQGNRHILTAMGATPGMIRRIYIIQGWLISAIGGLTGIVAGTLLVLAQQHLGLIKLGAADNANLVISVYPVELHLTDLLIVAAIVVVMGLFNGLIATRR